MTDIARRMRQARAVANLPEPDTSDPHLHGKPTEPRIVPRPPTVVIQGVQWPDCEWCIVSGHHVRAVWRCNIGVGSDRNLCDPCYRVFGNTGRQLMPNLGSLMKGDC